ncbi:MAG: NUDIX domain-containing protein [Anaerolineales bacterium]|nr:NUDIX domain-containing protein [Anaerolineales bacterium]
MVEATLCFLVQGKPISQVLLGWKKRGFGCGKYGGFGGKVEAGETIRQAALREMEEESSVRVVPEHCDYVGRLDFRFPFRPGWSQVVHVFLATRWRGEPRESGEMRPLWFALAQIPYASMWQDSIHWLPPILAGRRLEAVFTFKADNETVDEYEIKDFIG